MKFRTRSLTGKCAPGAESSTHSFAFWRFSPGVSPPAKFSRFSNPRRCSVVCKSRRQKWRQFESGSTTVRSAGVLMRSIARDLVCLPSRKTAGAMVWTGCYSVVRCVPRNANYSMEFYLSTRSRGRARNCWGTLSNFWSGCFLEQLNSASRVRSPSGSAIYV